eukprot:771414-Prorocentrum_minimum.AAC.4
MTTSRQSSRTIAASPTVPYTSLQQIHRYKMLRLRFVEGCEEKAALVAKYNELYKPIFAERSEIVAGRKEVELTEEEKAAGWDFKYAFKIYL